MNGGMLGRCGGCLTNLLLLICLCCLARPITSGWAELTQLFPICRMGSGSCISVLGGRGVTQCMEWGGCRAEAGVSSSLLSFSPSCLFSGCGPHPASPRPSPCSASAAMSSSQVNSPPLGSSGVMPPQETQLLLGPDARPMLEPSVSGDQDLSGPCQVHTCLFSPGTGCGHLSTTHLALMSCVPVFTSNDAIPFSQQK